MCRIYERGKRSTNEYKNEANGVCISQRSTSTQPKQITPYELRRIIPGGAEQKRLQLKRGMRSVDTVERKFG